MATGGDQPVDTHDRVRSGVTAVRELRLWVPGGARAPRRDSGERFCLYFRLGGNSTAIHRERRWRGHRAPPVGKWGRFVPFAQLRRACFPGNLRKERTRGTTIEVTTPAHLGRRGLPCPRPGALDGAGRERDHPGRVRCPRQRHAEQAPGMHPDRRSHGAHAGVPGHRGRKSRPATGIRHATPVSPATWRLRTTSRR